MSWLGDLLKNAEGLLENLDQSTSQALASVRSGSPGDDEIIAPSVFENESVARTASPSTEQPTVTASNASDNSRRSTPSQSPKLDLTPDDLSSFLNAPPKVPKRFTPSPKPFPAGIFDRRNIFNASATRPSEQASSKLAGLNSSEGNSPSRPETVLPLSSTRTDLAHVDVSGWADESDSGAAGFGSVDELSLPSQQENGDASPALPSHGVVSTSVNGEVPHEAAHEERSGLEDKPASISTHDSAEGEVLVNMAHADTSKRKRSQQEETLEAQAIHAQEAAALMYNAAQEECEALRKKRDELANEIAMLREKNSKLEQALKKQKQQDEEMHAEITRRWEQHSQEYNKTRTALKAKEAECVNVATQVDELRNQVTEKDNELVEVHAALEKLNEELSRHAHEAVGLDKDRERAREEMNDLRTRLEGEKEDLIKLVDEANDALQAEKDSHAATRQKLMEQKMAVENESHDVKQALAAAQLAAEELRHSLRQREQQLKAIQSDRDRLNQEFSDHKARSSRILKEKESRIADLEGLSNGTSSGSAYAVDNSELQRERDELQSELKQSQIHVRELKNELRLLEEQAHRDGEMASETIFDLERDIEELRRSSSEAQRILNEQADELNQRLEDMSRDRTTLLQKLTSREEEIGKLQKMIRPGTPVTADAGNPELEDRLHRLTDQLVQQQRAIERLTAENSSLALRLETEQDKTVRETKIRIHQENVESASRRQAESLRPLELSVPQPSDTRVHRGVRNAAGALDGLGIKIGVFLRRYPTARLLAIVYVVLLHVWVLIVLTTYTPEMHAEHAAELQQHSFT